ncbi:hypothetical protein I79_018125 [Cricetulus griseus]|uniref:Uncharacterized protein n=1 Tax=Cricetulus griseus TaxID=10029 RepID=G3I3V7_CRIGR|nr:hypothetical protein I79_018125 [Cricetulus griseus]
MEARLTPTAKHWAELLESSCREGGVLSKGIKTRLEKPTETADLNKGKLMDPRLTAGKQA